MIPTPTFTRSPRSRKSHLYVANQSCYHTPPSPSDLQPPPPPYRKKVPVLREPISLPYPPSPCDLPPPPPLTKKRYLYLADPDAGDGGDKEAAELWAFAASVLPRIDECDSDIAVTIRANTDISSSDAPVSEGFVLLKEKLESVYSCMGISCSQIGGLVVADSTEYYEGFEPCGDSSNKLDDAAIAGIVIGVVAVLAICGGVLLCKRRNKKKTAQAMSSDLGGFGNKATGTL